MVNNQIFDLPGFTFTIELLVSKKNEVSAVCSLSRDFGQSQSEGQPVAWWDQTDGVSDVSEFPGGYSFDVKILDGKLTTEIASRTV